MFTVESSREAYRSPERPRLLQRHMSSSLLTKVERNSRVVLSNITGTMRYNSPSLRKGKPSWVFQFDLMWTEDSSIGMLTKQRSVSVKVDKTLSRGEAALDLRDILQSSYPFRDYVLIR